MFKRYSPAAMYERLKNIKRANELYQIIINHGYQNKAAELIVLKHYRIGRVSWYKYKKRILNDFNLPAIVNCEKEPFPKRLTKPKKRY